MRAPDAEPLFFSRTYEFLEVYLPRQVCRSACTVESYRDALTVFRRYALEARGKSVGELLFRDVDRDFLLGFLEHLSSRGCSAGTCNQRLAAVRAYMWYAADADVALQSLALAVAAIPSVKGPERVKEALCPEALAAVLSAPDPAKKAGMRDRALLALLYDAALRLSELVALRVGDCALGGDPCVFVTGKGRKERVVAITPATAAHVSQVVAVYHGASPDPSLPVFSHTSGGRQVPLSPSAVQRIVDRHASTARAACPSVPAKCHPHMFRRTRATDLYRSGVPIELLSRILGHSSVETTRIYATPSQEMLREAMGASTAAPADERPAWENDEAMLARLCGLR